MLAPNGRRLKGFAMMIAHVCAMMWALRKKRLQVLLYVSGIIHGKIAVC